MGLGACLRKDQTAEGERSQILFPRWTALHHRFHPSGNRHEQDGEGYPHQILEDERIQRPRPARFRYARSAHRGTGREEDRRPLEEADRGGDRDRQLREDMPGLRQGTPCQHDRRIQAARRMDGLGPPLSDAQIGLHGIRMVDRQEGVRARTAQGLQQGGHLVSQMRDRPRRGRDRLLGRDRPLRHGQIPPEGREGRIPPHMDHHPLDPALQHGRRRPPGRDVCEGQDVRREGIRGRHSHEVPGGVRDAEGRIRQLRDPRGKGRKGPRRHRIHPAVRDRRRPQEDRIHLQGRRCGLCREGQHRSRPHRPRIRTGRLRDR